MKNKSNIKEKKKKISKLEDKLKKKSF